MAVLEEVDDSDEHDTGRNTDEEGTNDTTRTSPALNADSGLLTVDTGQWSIDDGADPRWDICVKSWSSDTSYNFGPEPVTPPEIFEQEVRGFAARLPFARSVVEYESHDFGDTWDCCHSQHEPYTMAVLQEYAWHVEHPAPESSSAPKMRPTYVSGPLLSGAKLAHKTLLKLGVKPEEDAIDKASESSYGVPAFGAGSSSGADASRRAGSMNPYWPWMNFGLDWKRWKAARPRAFSTAVDHLEDAAGTAELDAARGDPDQSFFTYPPTDNSMFPPVPQPARPPMTTALDSSVQDVRASSYASKRSWLNSLSSICRRRPKD